MLALSPALETGGRRRRATGCSSRRSSIRRCAAAGALPAEQVEALPVDGDGVVDLDALRAALARGRAAAGFGDARQQRDRRDSADPRRSPTSCTRPAACCMSMRCRAPGRIDCDINDARRRSSDPFRAQDRRAAGRRRADPARRHPHRRAADPRRRPGARPARRHRECRGHCRLRRGRAAAAGRMAGGRQSAWRRCATGWKPASRPRRRRRSFSARGAPRLPNTTLFAVPGLKAETAVIAFDLEAWRCRPAPPARRARCSPRTCWRPWGWNPTLARGALRVSLGWTTTEADIERC